MSLQSIIDRAVTVTFDRRKVVGIQYTRSEIARTELTPTRNPWRFKMGIPSFPLYQMRPILESLTFIDRYQPETITFNNNINVRHIFRQQTTVVFATAPQVVSFTGNQLVLTNLPAVGAADVIFASGDLIQINGFPYPFTVVTDVLRGVGANVTLTTHRPNIITSPVIGLNVVVGSTAQFRVFCPNMPKYKLVPGRKIKDATGAYINASLVEFDDDFEFYEWTGDLV